MPIFFSFAAKRSAPNAQVSHRLDRPFFPSSILSSWIFGLRLPAAMAILRFSQLALGMVVTDAPHLGKKQGSGWPPLSSDLSLLSPAFPPSLLSSAVEVVWCRRDVFFLSSWRALSFATWSLPRRWPLSSLDSTPAANEFRRPDTLRQRSGTFRWVAWEGLFLFFYPPFPEWPRCILSLF